MWVTITKVILFFYLNSKFALYFSDYFNTYLRHFNVLKETATVNLDKS